MGERQEVRSRFLEDIFNSRSKCLDKKLVELDHQITGQVKWGLLSQSLTKEFSVQSLTELLNQKFKKLRYYRDYDEQLYPADGSKWMVATRPGMSVESNKHAIVIAGLRFKQITDPLYSGEYLQVEEVHSFSNPLNDQKGSKAVEGLFVALEKHALEQRIFEILIPSEVVKSETTVHPVGRRNGIFTYKSTSLEALIPQYFENHGQLNVDGSMSLVLGIFK